MKNENNFFFSKLIWDLLSRVGAKRICQLVSFIFLSVVAAILEIVSLGSIIPFLAAITNDGTSVDSFYSNTTLSEILRSPLLPNSLGSLLLIFVCFYFISAIFRLFTIWVGIKLSFGIGIQLSADIFERYINQPYEYYISINSSDAVSMLTSKINSLIYETINPLVNMVSSSILILLIIIGLIIIDPFISIMVFGGIGLIYLIVIILTSASIKKK